MTNGIVTIIEMVQHAIMRALLISLFFVLSKNESVIFPARCKIKVFEVDREIFPWKNERMACLSAIIANVIMQVMQDIVPNIPRGRSTVVSYNRYHGIAIAKAMYDTNAHRKSNVFLFIF